MSTRRSESARPPSRVYALRVAYDQLLNGEIDCSPTDHKLGRVTRQIMQPFRYHPVFADNDALRRGLEIARLLFGIDDPQPISTVAVKCCPPSRCCTRLPSRAPATR